jgi:hypothetical protein
MHNGGIRTSDTLPAVSTDASSCSIAHLRTAHNEYRATIMAPKQTKSAARQLHGGLRCYPECLGDPPWLFKLATHRKEDGACARQTSRPLVGSDSARALEPSSNRNKAIAESASESTAARQCERTPREGCEPESGWAIKTGFGSTVCPGKHERRRAECAEAVG